VGAMGNGGNLYFDMGKPVKLSIWQKDDQISGFMPDEDIMIKIVDCDREKKIYEELLNDTSKLSLLTTIKL
jgi:FlaA1/EpsC-like NDP-sugar epimerase